MGSEPNYSKYTISELYDVLRNIDGDKFPERLEKIKYELDSRVLEDEKDYEVPIKKLSPIKKNALCFSVFFSMMLTILYSEYVPMRGFHWITEQTHPKLYWISVIIFGLWSCYYAKKYIDTYTHNKSLKHNK
ncbi:hypothetical protein [Pseudocolwellia agarivorans]|jgi:hypothetical protein|uniref:hypothetical protein n=1 Tax=Pseudocolwellia agarivorans TaxID=1911682 RepID=UPI003F88447B